MQLAVLVSNAKGFHRSLSDVDGHAFLRVTVFTKELSASRPTAEPVGHILEAIGIWHHDVDVDAVFHQDMLNHRLKESRVFPDLLALTALIHRPCAGQ